MEDFTKIKLINSLIDVVSSFYELKDGSKSRDIDMNYLKGFCEGMAYLLVEQGALKRDEAEKILKGVGKKIEHDSSKSSSNNLDIPTVFRKNIS